MVFSRSFFPFECPISDSLVVCRGVQGSLELTCNSLVLWWYQRWFVQASLRWCGLWGWVGFFRAQTRRILWNLLWECIYGYKRADSHRRCKCGEESSLWPVLFFWLVKNTPPAFYQVHWNDSIKLNNFLLFFFFLNIQCFVSYSNICCSRMSNHCGRAKLLWLEEFCKNMGFYIRQTWRFWLVWGSSKWGRNKKLGRLRDCSLCLVCYLRKKHSWIYRKLSLRPFLNWCCALPGPEM